MAGPDACPLRDGAGGVEAGKARAWDAGQARRATGSARAVFRSGDITPARTRCAKAAAAAATQRLRRLRRTGACRPAGARRRRAAGVTAAPASLSFR